MAERFSNTTLRVRVRRPTGPWPSSFWSGKEKAFHSSTRQWAKPRLNPVMSSNALRIGQVIDFLPKCSPATAA
jgi:hypothetical protein